MAGLPPPIWSAHTLTTNEIILNYEPSFFQDFESFLRTMWRAVEFFAFTLQKFSFSFETYEIPPGIHDVVDINSTLHKLTKAIVSIDSITMKSWSKSNNVLKLNGNLFWRQNWDVAQIGILNMILNIKVKLEKT